MAMKGSRACKSAITHARIGFPQLFPKPADCIETTGTCNTRSSPAAYTSAILDYTAPLTTNLGPLHSCIPATLRSVRRSISESSGCRTSEFPWLTRPVRAFASQAPFHQQQQFKWQVGHRATAEILELKLPIHWQQQHHLSTYLQPGCPVQFGESWSVSRVFNTADVDLFTTLTGDCNPIHSEQAAAEAAGFAKPVSHGMLAASLFPAIMGSRFPGSVYVSQTLRFLTPTFVGEEVHAHVEVIAVLPHKHRYKVTMATKCWKAPSNEDERQDAESGRVLVLDGIAVLLLPSL